MAAFVSRIDLTDQDMGDLMLASRLLKDADAAAAPVGAAPLGVGGLAAGELAQSQSRAVACAWVRGAKSVWAAWVPAICPPGQVADSTLSRSVLARPCLPAPRPACGPAVRCLPGWPHGRPAALACLPTRPPRLPVHPPARPRTHPGPPMLGSPPPAPGPKTPSLTPRP